MKKLSALLAVLTTALLFSSCSSIEPYEPYGVDASVRRLIWSSSWRIVQQPIARTNPGPRIKDIEIINVSDNDAIIEFCPHWETKRIAFSSIRYPLPDEQPEMALRPGGSLFIHVEEPAFFRDGAFIVFFHRMSDAEMESSELREVRDSAKVGFRPYVYSDFRRLTGPEMSGDGLLRIRIGSNANRSQQDAAHIFQDPRTGSENGEH